MDGKLTDLLALLAKESAKLEAIQQSDSSSAAAKPSGSDWTGQSATKLVPIKTKPRLYRSAWSEAKIHYIYSLHGES